MIFDVEEATDRFVLEGKIPRPEPDNSKWIRGLYTNNRTVAKTKIAGVEVSTVFLGLDHSFGRGPRQLFETMVFW